MPTRAPHVCSRCRVNYTHNKGPCDTCATKANKLRGSAHQRGYGASHRKRRDAVLDRDPLCVACLSIEKVEPASVYDHIVPIESGGDQQDMENAQGLCDTCHNVKRAAESRGRQMEVQHGKGLVDIGPLGTPARRYEREQVAA